MDFLDLVASTQPSKPTLEQERYHRQYKCRCYYTARDCLMYPETPACVVKPYENFKAEQINLQLTMDKLKSDTEQAAQTNQNLKAANDELRTTIKDFEMKEHTMKKKFSNLEDDLRIQATSFEVERIKLQCENDQLKSKTEIAKQTIQKLQTENGNLNAQLKDFAHKFFKSESEQNVLQKKISDLESDLQAQAKSFDDKQLNLPTHDLEKRVTDLEHELETKKTIYFSKEKRFLKIIDELQFYISSLELDQSSFEKQPKTSSDMTSKVSELKALVLNDSFLTKFKQIEKRIDTIKTKSFDTQNKGQSTVKAPVFQKRIMVSVGAQVLIPEDNTTELSTTKVCPKTIENKLVLPESTTKTPMISKPKKSLSPRQKVYSSYQTNSNRPFLETTHGKNGEVTGFKDQYGWFPHKPNKPSNKSCVKIDHVSETKPNLFSKHVSSKKWKTKREFSSSSTSYNPIKYSVPELLGFKPRPVSLAKPKSFDFPLRPQNLFFNDTPCIKPRWNAMSISQIDSTYKWYSKSSLK